MTTAFRSRLFVTVAAFGTVHCAAAPATECPGDMVAIPGGSFTMGMEVPEEFWHMPAQEVVVGSFCIDRYEYPNRVGALPKSDVGWYEARRQCRNLGKRLCASAEWERACRGLEGWRYSYGPVRDPAACNTHFEGRPPGRVPLAEAGSFPRCQSPEGVYDLNGSLSEWVEDPWYGETQSFEPWSWPWSEAHVLRGGTMWSVTFYGQDCLSTHGHSPRTETGDDGFRCCLSLAE